MDRARFLEDVRVAGRLEGPGAALTAARAVVCALRERLSADEVEHLREVVGRELPELFSCPLRSHRHAPAERPAERLTEPEIAERVKDEAGLLDLSSARQVIRVVTSALSERLGAGEVESGAPNEARGLGGLGEPTPRRRRGEEPEE